jgi:cytosine/adenosine deaminase-related metal-dependent hydrolase
METFLVIKNALVLTLDRRGQTGYFNIIIKNGKIFIIDYENKFNEKEFRLKNPEAEIIDAKNKLIMPGLFNSKLISSYSLNKFFLKKCSYENISSWLSLNLIDRYLSNIENLELQKDILKTSYTRSLLNGEIFVNESSTSVKKDFFDVYFTDSEWIKQYYNLTSYDYTILNDLREKGSFVSVGFKADEDINNYSLSSVKKSLSGNKLKLFIDASLSQKTFESVKKVFGKSYINVLAETDLITNGTVISNPLNMTSPEIEILKNRKSSLLILPSDYINLSEKKIDFDELFFSGLNIIIGTGYTGNDILSELKILPALVSSGNLTYENILRTANINPSFVFGISNLTGTIERNKSADIIFFDTGDIRNVFTFPDTDSESVCEFIIKNLSAKDISDVILKGEVLIKDRKELFQYPGVSQIKTKEISDNLYQAGKYFEFKEKYLMRGRVDKLGLDNDDEESGKEVKEEIFVDMTETGEYVGEGEFTIVGAKEEEFEKPRQRDEEKKPVMNLREIKSIEDDLNLFEGLEESQQVIKPRSVKKKDKTEKEAVQSKEEVKEKLTEIESEGLKNSDETEIEMETETKIENKKEEPAKPEFKNTKLKFGFKDDE